MSNARTRRAEERAIAALNRMAQGMRYRKPPNESRLSEKEGAQLALHRGVKSIRVPSTPLASTAPPHQIPMV